LGRVSEVEKQQMVMVIGPGNLQVDWCKSKISCHKQVAFRGGWPSWLLRSRDKKMKAMEDLAEDPWPSNHHYRREREQMGLCFGTTTIPRSQICLLARHMSSKHKHNKVLVD